MQSTAKQPLKGKTVIVTRAIEQQGKAKEMLESLGATVMSLPVLIIEPPSDWRPLDNALRELESFDWIIFSSANGVQAVEERLNKIEKCLSQLPKQLNIAAMGIRTAELIKKIGAQINFIPPNFVADSLIKHFPVSCKGLKILLPRVQSGGRTILAEAFETDGAHVIEVAAYESSCPKTIPEDTLNAIKRKKVDAIAFTSGKSAMHTAELLKQSLGGDWAKELEKVKLISIGPQTTLSIQKCFGRVSGEANPHDLQGLTISCIKSLNSI